jgi:alpha-tubulin suppressor-like RCC1 family protein
MKTLKFTYWPKRITQGAALLSVLSLSSVAPLTAIAADSSVKDQPKIVQWIDPHYSLAIDDQGNAWCLALHAISVKDGFFPNPMVKATSITDVKINTSRFVLKNDGTVWAVERISENEQPDYKEHISATLGERIPRLENIVEIDTVGTIVLALDKYGKLWIIETVKYDDSLPLKAEPVLVEGLDHIKDILVSTDYNEITFLKEDGTVWNIDDYSPWGSSRPLFDTIRFTKPVQLENLKDIVQLKNNHYAIKKDGTVWNWGRTTEFSKSNPDPALTPAAPYQIEELSDVVDVSSTFDHVFFVKKDGTVWGKGYFVEKWEALGAEPQKVWKDLFKLEGIEDAASVNINNYYLSTESIIKKDGTVWMWGLDHFSKLIDKPQQVEFRN